MALETFVNRWKPKDDGPYRARDFEMELFMLLVERRSTLSQQPILEHLEKMLEGIVIASPLKSGPS